MKPPVDGLFAAPKNRKYFIFLFGFQGSAG